MIIDPLFQYTTLSQDGRDKAAYIAEVFSTLLYALEDTCPKGREFSIVRTKLEEASFYAKKSLVSVDKFVL